MIRRTIGAPVLLFSFWPYSQRWSKSNKNRLAVLFLYAARRWKASSKRKRSACHWGRPPAASLTWIEFWMNFCVFCLFIFFFRIPPRQLRWKKKELTRLIYDCLLTLQNKKSARRGGKITKVVSPLQSADGMEWIWCGARLHDAAFRRWKNANNNRNDAMNLIQISNWRSILLLLQRSRNPPHIQFVDKIIVNGVGRQCGDPVSLSADYQLNR